MSRAAVADIPIIIYNFDRNCRRPRNVPQKENAMQLIYRASDITEAHIVSGMLQANGLESFVGGHYLQGAIGDMAVQDFAVVHVADEDVTKAKRLIADYEARAGDEVANPEPNAVRRAARIGQSSMTRLLTAVVVLVCMLIVLFIW